MLANYGYSDGSGNYFITIDTDKCNACGECVEACPANIFEIVDEDPNDPMNEEPLAIVSSGKRKKLKYKNVGHVSLLETISPHYHVSWSVRAALLPIPGRIPPSGNEFAALNHYQRKHSDPAARTCHGLYSSTKSRLARVV